MNKKIEVLFEKMLWDLRLVVIVAVIVSALLSLVMFYVATVDAWITVTHLLHYADPTLDDSSRLELRNQTVTHVVEVIDGFLLATILLIFALGLYELFISKIDPARAQLMDGKCDAASNILVITSIDDLKNRLAKVILMILVIKFFEYGINMGFKEPLDLLIFAAGIALIGLALFLSHKAEEH
ncbi:MAG: YqhA family protein [Gammaproteobacteria bacterium]|nr:YqhA family protein [Gammaproteobacteria bacterium]